MQCSPYEIKDKLLKALDEDNNVVDMAAVIEVITLLERTPITKDTLERTRLGKYINELRKRTSNEPLARRAKELVKSWRRLLPCDQTPNGGGARTAPGRGAPPPQPQLLERLQQPRAALAAAGGGRRGRDHSQRGAGPWSAAQWRLQARQPGLLPVGALLAGLPAGPPAPPEPSAHGARRQEQRGQQATQEIGRVL